MTDSLPCRRTGASLLLALLLAGCADQEPPAGERVRPVRTIIVGERLPQALLAYSGRAEPAVTSRMSFRVEGIIESLPVGVGDRVKKGDLIARLDTELFELDLKNARAGLERARAEANTTRAQLERSVELYKSGVLSRNDYDTAVLNHDKARAGLSEAQNSVEILEQKLSFATLTSPETECTVADVLLETSENTRPGDVVAILACGSTLEVEIAVPDRVVNLIQIGDPVDVTFGGLPGERFDAVIARIGTVATDSTTYPVTVRLQSGTGRIRAGMAATVSVPVSQSTDGEAILVPPEAVSADQSGSFVFIVEDVSDDIGTVRRRPVALGPLNRSGSLTVTEGLDPGTVLVTAGLSQLYDGRRVRMLGTE